jgi:hypothetical protein
MPSIRDAVVQLAVRFSGELIQPADLAYEAAQKVHNGAVDKRPELIARCRGVRGIVETLAMARNDGGGRPRARARRIGGQGRGLGRKPLRDAGKAVKPRSGRSRLSGNRVMDTLGPIPYCAMNSILDAAYPPGGFNYWKSQFPRELSDAAIKMLVDRFEACGPPTAQILLEHFHGAVCRVDRTDTACAMRDEGDNLIIISQWQDPSDTDRCITWARDTYAAMQPFFGTSRSVNYLDDDDIGSAAAQAYGPNYSRLREIKTRYDPDNVFHLNLNIPPTRLLEDLAT